MNRVLDYESPRRGRRPPSGLRIALEFAAWMAAFFVGSVVLSGFMAWLAA